MKLTKIVATIFWLVAVLHVFVTADGIAIDESNVVYLTDKTFESTLKAQKNALVEFYAPWCGHCKSLTPKYAEAATILKKAGDNVILAKVDATTEKKSAELFNVKGYPTLLWIADGQLNSSQKYTGPRETEDLVSYVRRKSGPAIQIIDSEEAVPKAEKSSELIGVAYFKELKGSEYEALEAAAKNDDDVKILATSDADLAKKLGLTGVPSFALISNFKGEERGFEPYTQKSFEQKSIQEFVKTNKLPLVVSFNFNTQSKIFSSDIKKQVIMIGPQKEVSNHIKSIQKVARQFQGKLLFLTVDSDDKQNVKVVEYFGGNQALDKISLIGFSMISSNKYASESEFSESVLESFCQNFLKDKLKPFYKSQDVPEKEVDSDGIHTVVGKSFERIVMDPQKDVFFEVYAPWCGHCKALKPVLSQLAQHFNSSESVVIATMDGTENEISDFIVSGFPTIHFYPANDKGKAVKYEGDRNLQNFIQYIKENAKKPIGSKQTKKQTSDEL